MDNSKRTSLLFIIFWITLFSTHTIFTCADQAQNDQAKESSPSPQEILFDTYSLFTKASLQYWENVKSLFNQAQLSFTNKDDVSIVSGGGKQAEIGTTERLKDAAEKSFEQTKEAVEGSAKTAADAVHDAAEKVGMKDKVPPPAPKENVADHGGEL
ncbi:PREDICTED: uncharacterized protein LOC109172514 [Ipomoea nil]|uniref:uncharacterized protein LOC109172514 n=1 Tax=Ipomoea nil TaxID=35883 RepID=UPI000900C0FB|nr:PREDICTED: uncharacterized protein LOC109172514 [Ipomoea nil]